MDNEPDYDDPDVEEAWCEERRQQVIAYVKEVGISYREVGEWPAWHVAPYVAIWAIESFDEPGWVGHWVICGDLPTDLLDGSEAANPREAVMEFARRWGDAAPVMARGDIHPAAKIGRSSQQRKSLAPLLESRAKLLARWAEDDEVWEDLDD